MVVGNYLFFHEQFPNFCMIRDETWILDKLLSEPGFRHYNCVSRVDFILQVNFYFGLQSGRLSDYINATTGSLFGEAAGGSYGHEDGHIFIIRIAVRGLTLR